MIQNALVLKFKRLTDTMTIPTKAHETDACFDLYADVAPNGEPGMVEIPPGETVFISTGFATEIPEGYFGAVFPRSGLSSKKGLRLANCQAIIDSPYRGEWKIALHNDSKDPQTVAHGDRIAQFTLMQYPAIRFEEVSELQESDRGDGGFGSSGK